MDITQNIFEFLFTPCWILIFTRICICCRLFFWIYRRLRRIRRVGRCRRVGRTRRGDRGRSTISHCRFRISYQCFSLQDADKLLDFSYILPVEADFSWIFAGILWQSFNHVQKTAQTLIQVGKQVLIFTGVMVFCSLSLLAMAAVSFLMAFSVGKPKRCLTCFESVSCCFMAELTSSSSQQDRSLMMLLQFGIFPKVMHSGPFWNSALRSFSMQPLRVVSSTKASAVFMGSMLLPVCVRRCA